MLTFTNIATYVCNALEQWYRGTTHAQDIELAKCNSWQDPGKYGVWARGIEPITIHSLAMNG